MVATGKRNSKASAVKYKKKAISKAIKLEVWKRCCNGDMSIGSCLCPFCNVITIHQMDFDAAHIIAEAKGGPTIANNICISCRICNLSASTNTMKLPLHLQPICCLCSQRIDPLKIDLLFNEQEQPYCKVCPVVVLRAVPAMTLPVPGSIKACCSIQ
jgi:hypothetical protein